MTPKAAPTQLRLEAPHNEHVTCTCSLGPSGKWSIPAFRDGLGTVVANQWRAKTCQLLGLQPMIEDYIKTTQIGHGTFFLFDGTRGDLPFPPSPSILDHNGLHKPASCLAVSSAGLPRYDNHLSRSSASLSPNLALTAQSCLAALFVRHRAEKVLGIHLIHGHFQIPSSVHGHIFVLTNGGLRAYEFQDGPLPDLSNVGQGFLAEFSRYIMANNLAGLIVLQVLGGRPCSHLSMFELVLDQGTIMLDTSIVKSCRPTRVTGWTFEFNETYAEMSSGNYKVFNAGKPLPKLENVDDIKAALIEAGVM
ncbi:hypothetical protein BN1723_012971 [Verticillium longisporum]|uniref:Uncharacterized protein n=1 Tax=Verticillium longisporum TaxID=100787 RepID=A0A0G4LN84_VERLO|nr:hypothetical protein BN1708_012518 [Verticillium longisporum]CRK23458.1 hypothetical protein BN1723_012971 [Verticillium longisporum]